MKNLFLTTLFLVTFFCHTSYAQNDSKPVYIISSIGDTTFGIGYIGWSQDYCSFKGLNSSEFRQISPEEVNTFRIIDGKKYISGQVPDFDGKIKWFFLEFLVDGKVDLFTIGNSERFYIQKEGGEILELNDNIQEIIKIEGKRYNKQDKRYIGKMKLLMSDAPELFPQIEKLENLNQRELVDLSVNYHNSVCTEYECINYAKKIPRITYKLELLTGVNKHSSEYTPQYGVLVHFWRPLANEKLYLKTGIVYSYDHKESSYNKNNEKVYGVKIPVRVQYVFGKKAFRPTVSLGYANIIYLMSSFEAGFLYSVLPNLELSCSASTEAILYQTLSFSNYLFDNNFPHSLNFGLVYKFKQR